MLQLTSFSKFTEKFKEVKDAARLAREKSQDKELVNTALTIAAPQVRHHKKDVRIKVEHHSAGVQRVGPTINVQL